MHTSGIDVRVKWLAPLVDSQLAPSALVLAYETMSSLHILNSFSSKSHSQNAFAAISMLIACMASLSLALARTHCLLRRWYVDQPSRPWRAQARAIRSGHGDLHGHSCQQIPMSNRAAIQQREREEPPAQSGKWMSGQFIFEHFS
jgi:hypothetical protein